MVEYNIKFNYIFFVFFFLDNNYESSVQSVCIMLNGEESELRFMNEREMSVNIALFLLFTYTGTVTCIYA